MGSSVERNKRIYRDVKRDFRCVGGSQRGYSSLLEERFKYYTVGKREKLEVLRRIKAVLKSTTALELSPVYEVSYTKMSVTGNSVKGFVSVACVAEASTNALHLQESLRVYKHGSRILAYKVGVT